MIRKVYAGLPGKVAAARKVVGRPLALTEKILYAHLHHETNGTNGTDGTDEAAGENAAVGAAADLGRAREVNREVYAFLESVAAKYGIGFWEPGAGGH
jgi:aconitate hydratase